MESPGKKTRNGSRGTRLDADLFVTGTPRSGALAGVAALVQSRVVTTLLILLVAVTGVALSAGAFRLLQLDHLQRVRVEFERAANERAGAIEQALRRVVDPLIATGSFVANAEALDLGRFSRFTRPLLASNPGVKALSYVARVDAAERARFEAQAARTLPGFVIADRDPDQGMAAAARRDEYFPVLYIEPMAGNERAIGFDLASQATRRAALASARDAGNVVATARIRLVQEQGQAFSFLLIHPLYRGGVVPPAVDRRREDLRGYVTEVIRVADLVEQALSILEPAGIDLAVTDQSGPPGERLLHFHASRRRSEPATYDAGFGVADERLRLQRRFEMANRTWSVEAAAHPQVFSTAAPLSAWGAAAAGLAFTALLVSYLRALRDHASRLVADRASLGQRVRERTAQLETAHAELLRKERLAALGQLTGGVAHELRNPLATVLNSIELVDMRVADEGVKRNLARARRNVHRCDRIVTELLDFARARGPALEPIVLKPWLQGLLQDYAYPEGIVATSHFEIGELAIPVDPDMLQQALLNLLDNACHAALERRDRAEPGEEIDARHGHDSKHTAGGAARVTVTARIEDASVLIEVADNGPGIGAAERERIFEPLYSTKSFGVGLGLSIVQRIVQQHHGRLEIFSEPGKGTRAVLSLPRAPAAGFADG